MISIPNERGYSNENNNRLSRTNSNCDSESNISEYNKKHKSSLYEILERRKYSNDNLVIILILLNLLFQKEKILKIFLKMVKKLLIIIIKIKKILDDKDICKKLFVDNFKNRFDCQRKKTTDFEHFNVDGIFRKDIRKDERKRSRKEYYYGNNIIGLRIEPKENDKIKIDDFNYEDINEEKKEKENEIKNEEIKKLKKKKKMKIKQKI